MERGEHANKELKQMKQTLFIFSFLLIFSCKNTTSENQKNTTNNPQTNKQLKPTYAKGFLVEYYDTYKILHILQPFSNDNFDNVATKSDTLSYVLAQQNTILPKNIAHLPVIKIPVKKIIVLSTTHLALLELLEAENIIIGASNTDYIYSEKIKNLVTTKKITKIDDQNLNTEQILALSPDLVMASALPATQYKQYQPLITAGVPVLLNAEWLEKTPLGKTEWLKVMAVLIDKEQKANVLFDDIATKYLRTKVLVDNFTKKLIENKGQKKTVFCGFPYKDTWHTPAGESFMANFLADAGANYIFSDIKGTASIPISMEKIYQRCTSADIWLNVDIPETQENSKNFELMKGLKAYQNKEIYSRSKRINGQGNDYWESGVVRPDVVLEDLVKIFYPELQKNFTEKSFFYYKKVQIK